jgi:hypothetical protein
VGNVVEQKMQHYPPVDAEPGVLDLRDDDDRESAFVYPLPVAGGGLSHLLSPTAIMIALLREPEVLAMFPQMVFILLLALLLPLTTVANERGFSTLKRVKTRLRTRMLRRTLERLMRIVMDGPRVRSATAEGWKDAQWVIDEALDIWFNTKNRRVSSTPKSK